MAATEREKMMAGELYDAYDAELVEARARVRRLLWRYNGSDPDDVPARRAMLAEMLGSAGVEPWIEPPFFCDYGLNIHAGAHLYLNFNCVILDCARIDIGDDVLIGPGVHIYAATHPVSPEERASGPELARPVAIGSRVWIGGGAIVMPGVTIGDGTTVGAGSVVTRDLPPYVVAAGNPCRVVRSLR
jgi:maltose O-acetyltransferase